MENATRDQNDVPALLVTSAVDGTPMPVLGDPVTGAMYVILTGGAENWTLTDNVLSPTNSTNDVFILGNLGVGIENEGSAKIEVKTLSEGNIQGLRMEGDNLTNIQFSSFLTNDNYVRFSFLTDGMIKWGAGNLVADTNLYRLGVGNLNTDNIFSVNSTSHIFNPNGSCVIGGNQIQMGSYNENYSLEGITISPQNVYIPNIPSGGGVSNLYWNPSNGQLSQAASSLRYKDNVVPLIDDFEKILKVSPKTYSYKLDGNKDIGYIAEEFDEAGLKYLVNYDNQGRPDSIKYDRIVIYLLETLKNVLQDRFK